jgi:hypothetical protein
MFIRRNLEKRTLSESARALGQPHPGLTKKLIQPDRGLNGARLRDGRSLLFSSGNTPTLIGVIRRGNRIANPRFALSLRESPLVRPSRRDMG